MSDDSIVSAYAELARLRAEVERWKTVASEMSQQREHNANEASRIRAEVERWKGWEEMHDKALGLICNHIDNEKSLLVRAEKAEAALAAMKGTP
jgi:hypothetical protein